MSGLNLWLHISLTDCHNLTIVIIPISSVRHKNPCRQGTDSISISLLPLIVPLFVYPFTLAKKKQKTLQWLCEGQEMWVEGAPEPEAVLSPQNGGARLPRPCCRLKLKAQHAFKRHIRTGGLFQDWKFCFISRSLFVCIEQKLIQPKCMTILKCFVNAVGMKSSRDKST